MPVACAWAEIIHFGSFAFVLTWYLVFGVPVSDRKLGGEMIT